MPEPTTFDRSLDQLEAEMISYSQRMNVIEYDFLVVAREYDIREGWEAWNFNNRAEWLNFKCGIQVATGREKIRVARQLFDLPRISDAFATGLLSYSKVRALTRVATPLNEASLVEIAMPATASQVDEYCRRLRNANPSLSTKDANQIHQARYLCCNHHLDGSSTISVELSRESADLVMKAIEIVTAREATTSGEKESYFGKQADGLVSIARDFLAGGCDKLGCRDGICQVVRYFGAGFFTNSITLVHMNQGPFLVLEHDITLIDDE